jgi:hypothetical protein
LYTAPIKNRSTGCASSYYFSGIERGFAALNSNLKYEGDLINEKMQNWTPPVSPEADFGILFLHNEGYNTPDLAPMKQLFRKWKESPALPDGMNFSSTRKII